MKRPGFYVWLLGSRFTAPPIMLGLIWYIRNWWQTGGVGSFGIIAIALLIMSAKAAYEVTSYRQWKAQWRAMAPGGQTRRWRPNPRMVVTILGGATVFAAIAYATSPEASPAVQQALLPVASGAAALSLAMMLIRNVRRRGAHARATRVPLVAIAVRKPVVALPSLRGCYRRLPPYCQLLLQGQS